MSLAQEAQMRQQQQMQAMQQMQLQQMQQMALLQERQMVPGVVSSPMMLQGQMPQPGPMVFSQMPSPMVPGQMMEQVPQQMMQPAMYYQAAPFAAPGVWR